VKLLLDTHIWIWSLHRRDKISRAVLRQLENPKNELFLSPISIWEAHLLDRSGRLRLKETFSEWLRQAFAASPLREAPFNLAVAKEAARIRLPQNDMADLFLAATAAVLDLTIVTSDSQFIACKWLKTMANE